MWSEKYLQWKAGIRLNEISVPRQLFFKTKPTSEQIMLLDMYEQRMATGYACMFFLIGFFGIIIGLLLASSGLIRWPLL
jgi:hypothetical protein